MNWLVLLSLLVPLLFPLANANWRDAANDNPQAPSTSGAVQITAEPISLATTGAPWTTFQIIILVLVIGVVVVVLAWLAYIVYHDVKEIKRRKKSKKNRANV